MTFRCFFSEIVTIWNEPLIPGPYLMVFREAGQLFRFTQTSLRIMLRTMCFKYVTGDCSFEMLQGPSCCWNRRFANCSSISLYVSLVSKCTQVLKGNAHTTLQRGWGDFSPGLQCSGLCSRCSLHSSSKDSTGERVCQRFPPSALSKTSA